MKKIYRKIYVILIIFCVSIPFAKAQKTMQYMYQLPQVNNINPAMQPECNGFFTLPGLSGANIAFGSPLSYDNIFKKHPEYSDSILFDFDKIESKMKDISKLDLNLNMDIISFGFRTGYNYLSFNLSTKVASQFTIPKDFIKLRHGNADFAGENNPLNLSDMNLDMVGYHEIGIGISHIFAENSALNSLIIGGGLKFLSGYLNINTEKSDIKLYTNENTYELRIEHDIDLKMSGPIEIKEKKNDKGEKTVDKIEKKDNIEDNYVEYFGLTGNYGFAADLGAVYKLNDRMSFNISVLDIGFINWKNNVSSVKTTGSFKFNGIDISEDIKLNENDNENRDILKEVKDSIIDEMELKKYEENYMKWLPLKIYAGGAYKLNKNIELGALASFQYYNKNLTPAFTFSANLTPYNWFSTVVSYSIMNGTYNNLGFGLSLRGGPFQFYFVSDHLSSTIFPKKTRNISARFGINFVFGFKKKQDFSLNEDI